MVAFVLGGMSVAVAVAIVVVTAVWLRRTRRAERDFACELDDMLLALSLIIAELSVGAPPVRACEVAIGELRRREGSTSRNRRSSIADGLEAMAGRASLGGSVIDAVATDPAADAIRGARSGIASWQRIGVAWHTAERHGLPMVDMLGALRSDLQSRRGFVERTRAGLSGPRATAMVLAGLPLLGVALGQATGARPVQILLGGGLGGILLVVGTALAATGVAWSERIVGRVLST